MTLKKENNPETPAAEKSLPKYSLDELQKHCQKLFGVSSAAFSGATASIAKKDYTIDEMKKIIENWNSKKIK